MKEIFCTTTAKTNDEYREVIKKRMRTMVLLIIIGFITALVGFGAESYLKLSINEHMLGVYTGVGTGLFVGGIILWIKNKLLLGNEDKLKESRLSNTDERIQEIGNRALRTATYVIIIVIYAIALIGGLFNQILFQAFMFVIFTFIIAYAIAYKYYNGKM
ncbi:hypothetical protein JK636_00945 [Clostridium sp. YIM B02515]|uniref:DUF2178 domain-containing protein n=1 Tax=Clostridium rhizosphaerae TaxID=2803861 RepID=A0ABS1T5C3_9CLOT|nr:DUF6442 family protein [Clostridium rhizosphaerae]MBL4934317.1 hypothetical protein [Clostridium rhizosphaerae]